MLPLLTYEDLQQQIKKILFLISPKFQKYSLVKEINKMTFYRNLTTLLSILLLIHKTSKRVGIFTALKIKED